MPPAEHRADDTPGDPFSQSIPHQPHNHALQNLNVWVAPAPANDGQPEGHREDRVEREVVGPDYHPQPIVDNLVAYVFPDAGHAQGIPAQEQPNAPVNVERDPFGYVPQQNASGPVPTAFPHLFVPRVRTPNPAGAENFRRLASRYLHSDAQVCLVRIEATPAGRFKVVIILESDDVF
ncbi:hypothetical protein DFH94DRAFT_760656 [Russula ochroleuca]|uniref:Uncharacterized protein n=1 Tax=Russula ochroleuca TaxID=152965 RepID=A0A9P5MRI1_9AGAM|nr:hypothetical protein DFH94DRAFT_760656 [Russula ochroleuca]